MKESGLGKLAKLTMKCVADQERHVQLHPQDDISFPMFAGYICSSAGLLVWGLVIEKYYVDELMLQKGGRVKFHFSGFWVTVWVLFFRLETELEFYFLISFVIYYWAQKHLGKGSPTFPFAIWCWAKFKYIFPCILLPHLMPLVPVT